MSDSGEKSRDSDGGDSACTEITNKANSPENYLDAPPDGTNFKPGITLKVDGTKTTDRSKKQEFKSFDCRNFILHQHFIRKDFNACKALIKEITDEHNRMSEYPLYIRGKIARTEGNLQEALIWFEQARSLNPLSGIYLREIGRLNFLLGNHVRASEVLVDAIKLDPNDWKMYYWRAMALYHIKQDSEAAAKAQECLLSAPSSVKRVEMLTFLAKLCEQRNDITPAIEAQKKALELEPENLDVLTNMGLLYARLQKDDEAFAAFGKALTYDPSHPQSILAAGSIIQTNGEHDVALTKYRIASEKCDYNGPLWNNIGMCFFGKGKYVAAISCLKKANYLCPLEWKICYNLGLVHNAMQQYASAYHFLSSAINLNMRSSIVYMALAVVLTNLDDIPNAKKAYDRALQYDKNSTAQLHLNYAIFNAKQNEIEKSAESLYTFYETITNKPKLHQEMISEANNLKKYLSQAAQCSTTPNAGF